MLGTLLYVIMVPKDECEAEETRFHTLFQLLDVDKLPLCLSLEAIAVISGAPPTASVTLKHRSDIMGAAQASSPGLLTPLCVC